MTAFGVAMFTADYAMNIVELGTESEARGFESLFVPEHTHIPAQRVTPYPGGGDLPPEYARTLDPFVALAAVATATTSLKVGTGICLVIQRDPIVMAKQVASVDLLSGGRFLFGVGAGWLREEIAYFIDPRTRWQVFGEQMQAMQAIWSNDEATFHGKFVNFDRIWSWPKPVQQPRPPVLLGGDYGAAMDRVIALGDEWMPHPDRGDRPFGERVAEFWQRCEAAGRNRLPITVYGSPIDARLVEDYAAAGATRVVFRIPPAPRDQVLPVLDRATEVLRQVVGG